MIIVHFTGLIVIKFSSHFLPIPCFRFNENYHCTLCNLTWFTYVYGRLLGELQTPQQMPVPVSPNLADEREPSARLTPQISAPSPRVSFPNSYRTKTPKIWDTFVIYVLYYDIILYNCHGYSRWSKDQT